MDYNSLLNTKSFIHWHKTGTSRRAGVAVPLFSLLSRKSVGIGEFRDLKSLADWCKETGFSIIQLLPLNYLGNDFSPYNAQSSFALEPAFITLSKLQDVKLNKFKKEIQELKTEFSEYREKADYSIKEKKLLLLRNIFDSLKKNKSAEYRIFKANNSNWLEDFALYRILKIKFEDKSWENWDEEYKNRNEASLAKLKEENIKDFEFHCWLQWQLYEQLRNVKKYITKNGILLKGDIPFLSSRDSADVWANQKYFKLNLFSGAPPDIYFADGQRWGMPPYNWGEIENDKYTFLHSKLRYASYFYDLYRIDHFVGLFRVWTIDMNEPIENAGLVGRFDPEDYAQWEEHGKKIVEELLRSASMLPCAEDLGTVPACSYSTIDEFGIPGMNVQRWMKNWDGDCSFTTPGNYRMNSVATISTHDSSFFPQWLKYEAGTTDESAFTRCLKNAGFSEERIRDSFYKLFEMENSATGRLLWKSEIENENMLAEILSLDLNYHYEIRQLYTHSFREKENYLSFLRVNYSENTDNELNIVFRALKDCSAAKSVFCIQQLFEWLFLEPEIYKKYTTPGFRINVPGIADENNWRQLLPVKLEELSSLSSNEKIKKILTSTSRVLTHKP